MTAAAQKTTLHKAHSDIPKRPLPINLEDRMEKLCILARVSTMGSSTRRLVVPTIHRLSTGYPPTQERAGIDLLVDRVLHLAAWVVAERDEGPAVGLVR